MIVKKKPSKYEYKKLHSFQLQRLVRTTCQTKTTNRSITKDYVTFAAQRRFGDVMHK